MLVFLGIKECIWPIKTNLSERIGLQNCVCVFGFFVFLSFVFSTKEVSDHEFILNAIPRRDEK